MIHTAQLDILITPQEKEYFINLDGTVRRRNDRTYKSFYFSGSGIRKVVLKRTDNTISLSAQVNLNRLALGGAETVHPLPASAEALGIACSNLAPKLDYFVPGRAFDDWKLRRIDYALDIKPGNVPLYIKLLQRGDKPHSYSISDGNRSHRDNSCDYACGSLELSFYDKHHERSTSYGVSQRQIDESVGILRFEMRSKTRKIRSLAGLGGWEDLSLASCQQGSAAIAAQMQKYLERCCRKGDYYTLAEARRRVNATPWTNPKKARAIEALELVNEKRSIWRARESLEPSAQKSFDTRLKHLESISINPVTIPERDGRGIQSLPSLLSLFEEKLTEWEQLDTGNNP